MRNDIAFVTEIVNSSITSFDPSFVFGMPELLPRAAEVPSISPFARVTPRPLPTEAILLETTPHVLSELLRNYLWSWPFVGDIRIDIDTESVYIYLAFRVWLKGNKQSDEQIVFTMALRDPKTLVRIDHRANPLRSHRRPGERGFYQRSTEFYGWGSDEIKGDWFQHHKTINNWVKPLPIESLEAALEIILPGFIKGHFPELLYTLYGGGRPQPAIREEARPLLTGKKIRRERKPPIDVLDRCKEALGNYLDKGQSFTAACQTAGTDNKTVNNRIPQVLKMVDEDTRARWTPLLKALGDLK
jgi:hypothetical protein